MTGKIFDVSKEVPLWIIRILMIIVIFSVIWFMTSSILRKNTDVSEIDSYTLKNRLFFSDNCMAYNENNRIIPGTIDIKNFEHDKINKCLKDTFFGVKLTLFYENKTKSIEINENIARQSVFCFDKSQLYCDNQDYFILVNEDNNIKNGILRIELTKLRRSTL